MRVFILISFCFFIFSCSKNNSFITPETNHFLLKKLRPKIQKFMINPSLRNKITGKKGSRFYIPPQAFDLPISYKKGTTIEINLSEYTSTNEMVSSGIPLHYTNEKGQQSIFESAGMFDIKALYKGNSLKLKNEKKIVVKFPLIKPGEKYFVYYMKDGKWIKHGHNQVVTKIENKAIPLSKKDRRRYKRLSSLRYRLYEIDRLAKWNFDYPNTDISCIQVNFGNNKNIPFQVVAAGVTYNGYTSWSTSKSEYSFNVLRNHKLRIFALDSEGRVAIIKKPISVKQSGFAGRFNTKSDNCLIIKPFIFKKVKQSILDNPKKFFSYVNFKEKKFKKRVRNLKKIIINRKVKVILFNGRKIIGIILKKSTGFIQMRVKNKKIYLPLDMINTVEAI